LPRFLSTFTERALSEFVGLLSLHESLYEFTQFRGDLREHFEGLAAASARQFGPRADRRFSLGDESAICALLTEAGFREISAKIIALEHFFPDAESFIPLNLSAIVPELAEMSEEDRGVAIARLRDDAAETLDRFASGAGLQHTMRANVVTANVE
jgi:hypothetical protein